MRISDWSSDVCSSDLPATGKTLAELLRRHGAGFFEGLIEGEGDRQRPYRLRFGRGSERWEEEDPYRFPPVLGDVDVYMMAEGTHRRLYERLGDRERVV